MIKRCLVLPLLLGCGNGHDGVSVGNPNLDTLLRVAPPGDGLQLDRAEVRVDAIVVSGVDDRLEVGPPMEIDVLAGVPLGLPAGRWSRIELELDGRFVVLGTDRGAELDLALEVPSVAVQAVRLPFELGEPHVFELAFPGWLSADEVGWQPGVPHVVRPSDPEHDRLVDFVTERSELLVDADGDGKPDR